MKKRNIFIIVLVVFLLSIFIIKNTSIRSNDIIRLHIISNDLSNEAVETKLLVRDSVLTYLRDRDIGTLDYSQAKKYIAENLSEIQQVAKKTLNAVGLTQNVSLQFSKTNIPAKMYQEKGFSLPSGNYETLNIRLGEAKGQNWWCVAFPTQCITERTVVKLNNEKKLVLKFKLLEWLKLNPDKATAVYQNILENIDFYLE